MVRLYCQSCDHSFVDLPCNAFPQCCPACGGRNWATWKRGERPAVLDLSQMTPAFNAGAAPPFSWYGTVETTFGAAGPGAIRIFSFGGTP